jgi:hypothetical protein
MQKFLRFSAVGAILLLLALGMVVGPEAAFSPGPTFPSQPIPGANGGYAWADMNGDGILDLFIPPNNALYNSVTSFTLATARAANVGGDVNTTPVLMADFNGDGVPDLWSTVGTSPQNGLYYDSAGVYVRPTTLGGFASATGSPNVFNGIAVADIDHSNYLTAVWASIGSATYADGLVFPKALGIEMLKGGAGGFTRIGKGAVTPAIDTSRSFESWQVHFFDANNDKYPDLLMPSFRHGFASTDIQVDSMGARKGCIMYMNDGTGKFFVQTAATLGRTIYNVDSISAGKCWGRAVADSGVVVDDTVRHFAAIGSTWGDMNNDGNFDLLLIGLNGNDNWNGNGALVQNVILYGKGDGTFTYKWNGTNIVNPGIIQGGVRAWEVGDYNNDGIPDLVASQNFAAPLMYRGNGDGTFTDVSSQIYLTGGGGRSGGFIDYNNDGFLDVYTRSGGGSNLLKNSGNSSHWIAFTPVGTGNNKSAIGARFMLYAQGGTLKQTRVIRAEANASGGQQLRANFGIGINASIDSVVVWWPDGTTASYTGLAVDRYWTVNKGAVNPATPALTTPANGAVGVATSGTLNWGASAGAVSYSVQAWLDPTFANTAMLAVNTTVSTTSYSYSLGGGTKYYWRVAAINGGFTSAYSAANNFTTTGAAAATVPTKVSPISKATNQPALLTLKVQKASDASRYQWQVSTLASFSTFFANDSTADTTYTATFVGAQTFYWRVRGMNDLGRSAYSAVDTFTIMAPPGRATQVAPANNTLNVIADSVIFIWRKVNTATNYNLQVSTVTSLVTYATTDTFVVVKNLTRLTNYSWKVEALNAGGTSFYTGLFAFTTVPAVPSAPSPLTPASAAAGIGRLTRFTWNASINATKYRLQIASDNAFATIVRDTTVLDTSAVLSASLTSNTDYYWRVNAQNLGGAGAFSTARLFTTGTATGVESLNSGAPKEFALYPNYPNPFNPSTTIRYDIAKNAYVRITIYDMLGRSIATLVDGNQVTSSYKVDWTPTNVGSGMYFCRIEARSLDGSGTFSAVKKLLFMK